MRRLDVESARCGARRHAVRGARPWAALGLALILMGGAGVAQADPGQGEGRSLLRDPERVVTTVAGDADASATTQNPGNLGLMPGGSFVLDASATAPMARLRGSGGGAFFGALLPRRLAAAGLGLQWITPWQPAATPQEAALNDPSLASADMPYVKLSMALAVPLVRWVPGLSVGVSVHQLVSTSNDWAHGTTSLDAGLAWHASRFVSLGLVARQLNVPVIDGGLGEGVSAEGAQRAPLTVDGEVAVRPLGTPAWELAAGVRGDTRRARAVRFRGDTFGVQPRVRMQWRGRGVGAYAQAELYANRTSPLLDPTTDVRLSAGLSFQLTRANVAAGALGGPLTSPPGISGGALHVEVHKATHARALGGGGAATVLRFKTSAYGGERGMFNLVRALDSLEGRRPPTVLLRVDKLGWGYAQCEEVREAIARLRTRGGRVAVYLDDVTTRSQFLASAADQIYAHPLRSMELLGLSIRRLYYGALLERLGVRAEFVRIAEYKGAAETYARDGASVPVAQQRRQLLVDIHNHLVRSIGRDRGVAPAQVTEWWNAAPIGAQEGRTLGIVDALAYPDELEEALSEWTGQDVNIQTRPPVPRADGMWGPAPTVAVVHIDGELVRGKSLTIPLLNRRLVGGESVAAQIDALRKDARVRAVVLRVNSPGGSVTGAETIARALDRLAETKPVVASFGSVAASGGYYVATSASFVVTDATTTTGSIGIFYPKMDISGLLDKVGVGVDAEATSAHAHLRSWLVPYDDATRAAAQADIARSYEVFTQRVGGARKMTPEEVDQVARGRVFSGVRALEVGLADRYGGLRDAVEHAAGLIGRTGARVSVRWVSSAPGPLISLWRLFGVSIPNPLSTADAETEAASLDGMRLPFGWRKTLAQLPAGLWWVEIPEPMAMSESAWLLE